MSADATAPAPLRRAAIVSGCKPKFTPLRTEKIVCLVFTAPPEQGALGKRVLACKHLPGVPPAQPRGQSGTGGPSQLRQHQTCVSPPQACTLTAQLLLAPARNPGGHFCAKLKLSYSGDMSSLPHCQDGQAHGMNCCRERRQRREEAHGEGEHNWKGESHVQWDFVVLVLKGLAQNPAGLL